MMLDRVTLLLEGTVPTTNWDQIGEPGRVVRVPSFQLLDAAIDTGLNDLGIEVESIVLDRSLSGGALLEFLCRLLSEFRGDVLAIQDDGSAYLSATTRGDGRIIYRLDHDDVGFYLFARFGAATSFNTPLSNHGH